MQFVPVVNDAIPSLNMIGCEIGPSDVSLSSLDVAIDRLAALCAMPRDRVECGVLIRTMTKPRDADGSLLPLGFNMYIYLISYELHYQTKQFSPVG